MTRCLVIGANGQDGSYLCDILLSQGHKVCGIGKQTSSRYISDQPNYSYIICDIADLDSLRSKLNQLKPQEIYHLAAVHGSHGFVYEDKWDKALDVNVKSLHCILEYSRQANSPPSIFYASSAKVFGTPIPERITSDQPLRPDCLYSITKIAAENLLNYYIKKHGLHGCIAYLFNHESPRRQSDFFIPSIVNVLQHALEDSSYKQTFNSLDFYCDWGCAKEYMSMAIKLLRKENSEKCIFATGVPTYARDLVEKLFNSRGLDYNNHIITKYDSTTAYPTHVDISSTEKILGYRPKRNIFDVCEDILLFHATNI